MANRDVEESPHDYNRITLGADFKSQICSQIADSTESLPHWQTNHRDSIQAAAEASAVPTHSAPTATTAATAGAGDGSDDLKTPMPKKDPLDQAGKDLKATTTRDSYGKGLTKVATATSDTSAGDEKSNRPGTLRRLTTRIRKTMSSKKDAE